MSRLRTATALATASAAAWLVAGWWAVPLVVMIATVVAFEGVRRAADHLGLAAGTCFVGAVLATVLESRLADEPSIRFALDRPVATAVGLTGGALLVAAVALDAIAGRRPTDDEPFEEP